MNIATRKLSITLLTLASALLTHNAAAATLIDDFSDFQIATNEVNHLSPILGTDLQNVKRTLTATSSTVYSITEIVSEDYLLTINNGFDTETTSLYYSFSPINLSALANAFLLTIEDDDQLPYQIQLIANGDSIYGFADFGGIGRHSINFSWFSNPNVFSHLKSLEIKFEGSTAWDGHFSRLMADMNSVPEPSVLALLLVGLLGMTGIPRGKDARVKA